MLLLVGKQWPKTIHKQKKIDVAYADVKRAFDYYLENYNNGRPIIIAGHSQGSGHGMRILKEYFDDKPHSKKVQ